MATKKLKLTRFVPSEYEAQCEVVQWAKWCKLDGIDLLFATLNGLRLPIGLAVKASKAGMNPGAPDLVLPVARRGHHGLFIEMKREKGGALSEAQIAWHIRLEEEGYCVVVAKGAMEAREAIREYLTEKEK